MNITYLKHGIVGILATALLGSALWFDREDGKQNQLQLQDVLELQMGLTERCLATQFQPDTTNSVNWDPFESHIVYQPKITGTETEGFYLPNGTNAPTFKPYSKITDIEIAGYYTNYWRNSQVFKIDPPNISGTIKTYDYTNRFILGTYSNITVSGFVNGGEEYTKYNGNYKLVGDPHYALAFTYENEANNSLHLTYNAFETTFFTDDYWSWWDSIYKTFVPWVTVTIENYSWNTGITTTNTPVFIPSNLITNKIIDSPVWKELPYTGWVNFNQLGKWQNTLGVIDNYLLGQLYTGYGMVSWWRNLMRQPKDYSTGQAIGGDYVRMSFFIDADKFGIDSYTNRFDLALDVSALWDYVGATNRQWYQVNGTNIVEQVAFDDNSITYYPYNGNYFAYGQGSKQITKPMLTQRYKALSGLKAMTSGGAGVYSGASIKWVKAYPSNNVVSYSGYSTNGYAAAVYNASTNMSYSTADGMPYSYFQSYKYSTPGVYYVWAGKKASKLSNPFIYSNLQSKVCYYAKSLKQPSPISSVSKLTYDAFDSGMIESNYVKFDSDMVYKNRTNAMSTVVIDSDPFLTIPPAPVSNYVYYVNGFKIVDDDVLIDWNFEYCNKVIE